VLQRRKGQPRSLSNKVVAITGAARGIGYVTARTLAREGALVAIGDLDGDLAAEAAAKLGGQAFGVALDVTDNAQFAAFLDEVEQRLGPLDVLINNAGIMTAGPIEAEDEAMTAREVAINLHAVIHGTREAVRRMKPRRAGHIVNIASAVAKSPGARCATYCATKAGVAGFSEAVAQELRGTGVEISVVLPSMCNTEMISGFHELRGMPIVEPEDVAGSIVETLERPRFEVPVPNSMGLMLRVNQALPFRARMALARVTKADSVLSRIDEGRRTGYAERLERMTAPPPEPSGALVAVNTSGEESP
jgi:NAD(P)-dependent dehydrogenase (short-subunit alcohol dehydrogenase family)